MHKASLNNMSNKYKGEKEKKEEKEREKRISSEVMKQTQQAARIPAPKIFEHHFIIRHFTWRTAESWETLSELGRRCLQLPSRLGTN